MKEVALIDLSAIVFGEAAMILALSHLVTLLGDVIYALDADLRELRSLLLRRWRRVL